LIVNSATTPLNGLTMGQAVELKEKRRRVDAWQANERGCSQRRPAQSMLDRH